MRRFLVPQFFLCLILLVFGFEVAQSQAPQINLLAHRWLQDSVGGTDVWGYVDKNTGKEYAIVGSWNSIHIWDASTPTAPVQVAVIDSTPGFDVKVWDTLVYSCSGSGFGLGYIYSIADPTNPVFVDTFPGAHNLWISENGHLYGASPGMKMYDLNADPTDPQLVWHDTIASGHDMVTIGSRLFFFGGYNGTYIYDNTNPNAPVLVDQIVDPNIVYHHHGYTSSDGDFLIIADELAKTPTDDLTVWNISVVGNPKKVTSYEDDSSIVHNVFVIGDYAYVSYYMNGFRIFDLADPTQMHVEAEYATYPDSSSENFGGAFGVYPFQPSGNIYVSDMKYGLFIFNFDSLLTVDREIDMTKPGMEVYPNPFVSQATIKLPAAGKIRIFNSAGKLVREIDASQKEIRWDGNDAAGHRLPTGLYSIEYRGEAGTASRKVFLY